MRADDAFLQYEQFARFLLGHSSEEKFLPGTVGNKLFKLFKPQHLKFEEQK
jgi:hypothetical protein